MGRHARYGGTVLTSRCFSGYRTAGSLADRQGRRKIKGLPGTLLTSETSVELSVNLATPRQFVEVKDSEAARQVLQLRQNAVLGTGCRARPVTITLSNEEALIKEVSLNSGQKLDNILIPSARPPATTEIQS